MKKTIAILLALMLSLGAVSCGGNTNNGGDTSAPDPSKDTTISDTNGTGSDTTPADDTTKSDAATEASDPLEVLNKVWGSYADDEKFSAVGGADGTGENDVDGAPGMFKNEASLLSWRFAYPEDQADKVDSVASLLHMLNGNTFTAAAFKLKDKADAADVTKALRDALKAKQWICGMPDKLVIFTVDSVVVSVFGSEELVNTFRDKLTAAYPDATSDYDEPI